LGVSIVGVRRKKAALILSEEGLCSIISARLFTEEIPSQELDSTGPIKVSILDTV
jgi:hypothetical protein